MLNKLAEELKSARIKSDLSLQQIANKTRIDLKFLEAIEEGNFSFLPDLYVKAFLKEYSKIVGLDENLILRKYEAAKKGKAYEENEEETGELKNAKQQEEPELKKENPNESKPYNFGEPEVDKSEVSAYAAHKKRVMIAGSAAAVVIIFLIVYFAFLQGGSQIIVPEKPYEQVRKESKERFTEETPKSKPENSIEALPSDSLLLNIETTDTSWVKILLDDSVTEEFTLFPYSKKDIKAKNNYKLIVGNAAAVHFKLNNKPLNFTGKNRQVRYILIDSAGFKYLSSPPNF